MPFDLAFRNVVVETIDVGLIEPFRMSIRLSTLGGGDQVLYAVHAANSLEQLRDQLTLVVVQRVQQNTVRIYQFFRKDCALVGALVDVQETAWQNLVNRSLTIKMN